IWRPPSAENADPGDDRVPEGERRGADAEPAHSSGAIRTNAPYDQCGSDQATAHDHQESKRRKGRTPVRRRRTYDSSYQQVSAAEAKQYPFQLMVGLARPRRLTVGPGQCG